MATLRNCPFCDSDSFLVDSSLSGKKMYWVKCDRECCEQTGYRTREEAIQAWNKRVADHAIFG